MSRRLPVDEGRMVATLTVEDGDGWEHEVRVPVTMAVCPGCRGRGAHVNRAVDGHGLTAEDFAEDPDFAEDYRRGVYDVTCEACDGRRVVPELPALQGDDAPQLTELQRKAIEQWFESLQQDAQDAAYRRMEMGGGW